MQPDELQNKFVAILNKKIPIGSLLNALGHMAAGLSSRFPDVSELRFDTYIDKDGGNHDSISDHPFIILSADNSNQIRTIRNQLLKTDIQFVDFTNTMTVGTYTEQKEKTQATPETELEYYGVCMFGNKETLNQLTGKFSLWR